MLRQQSQASQVEVWRNEVAQDFMVLLSVRPMYRGLTYIDNNGMDVISVQSDGRTVSAANTLSNRSATDYFQQAIDLPTNGILVSSFLNENTNSAPLVHYAMRASEGIILIDIHAGWLLRNLPSSLGNDTWALVDQSGRYLVYPEHFDPSAVNDDLTPMLNGTQGSFETQNSVYVYDAIFPSASVTDQFWVIYRETPKYELYAELSNFYIAAGGFTLIGVTFALLLAYLMSHRLSQPLANLKQMASEFGHTGILPQLPENLADDEIGTLTRTFYDMAQELERKRAKEHQLIERLIKAQEEERKLIAYDLHDGLIQQLVGARFYLSNCREACPIGANGMGKGIQRGCDALSEAIVEGRRIIEGLRPAALDDLGLKAAIEEHAQSITTAAGWELTLDLAPLPTEPETSVSVTLFRIAQEALNNARKHAKAQHVRVSLRNQLGISLRIEDDGIGFDADAITSESRGLGIQTMKERAALLGGFCAITTQLEHGTKIEVWVPNNLPQRFSSHALNGSNGKVKSV
ncbi:MAG: histidine kinase [Anaerolineae bacterium]